jgi:hypothetical protein
MQIQKTTSCKQIFQILTYITFIMFVYLWNFSVHKIQFQSFYSQFRNAFI